MVVRMNAASASVGTQSPRSAFAAPNETRFSGGARRTLRVFRGPTRSAARASPHSSARSAPASTTNRSSAGWSRAACQERADHPHASATSEVASVGDVAAAEGRVRDAARGAVGVRQGEEEAGHRGELRARPRVRETEDDGGDGAVRGARARGKRVRGAELRVVVEVELAHVEPVVRAVVPALPRLRVRVGEAQLHDHRRGRAARLRAGFRVRAVARDADDRALAVVRGRRGELELEERVRAVRDEAEGDEPRQSAPATEPRCPRARARGVVGGVHRGDARAGASARATGRRDLT